MSFSAGPGTEILNIPRPVWAEVFLHCQRELPGEACGILVGKGSRVSRAVPLPNVSPSPEWAYQADPAALYQVLFELEDRQEEMLAIYHSHPAGPPALSPADLEQAYWPGLLQVVVSLAGGENLGAAFRVEGCGEQARAVPVSLQIARDDDRPGVLTP